MDSPKIDASSIDTRALRSALGMFGTGVTIVTTRDESGMPVGMTANSFNSVSLEPPIILWSIARSARSFKAFTDARFWNVHVLAAEHEELSRRFARQGADKFSGIDLDQGLTAAPLLPGCSARFQCELQAAHEAGDHVVLLGRVIAVDQSTRSPLLWVGGNYAIATPRAPAVATIPGVLEQKLFTENLLGFLLGRAHLLYLHAVRPLLASHDLDDTQFYALTLLAVRPLLTEASMIAHLGFTGPGATRQPLLSLSNRGLAEENVQGEYRLTDRGLTLATEVLAECQAVQAKVEGHIGAGHLESLRHLLKQVIRATDPGLPPVWQ